MIKWTKLLLFFAFLWSACSPQPMPDSVSPAEPPSQEKLAVVTPSSEEEEPSVLAHSFDEDPSPILNPERGFYLPADLPGPVGFGPLRATGKTLILLEIHLDEYRQSDLPSAFLEMLDANFAEIRAAGLKAIPRFSYNQGPWPNPEPDAPLAQVLRHIEQVTPILQKNSDVIAWLQAGFIGAWGEWHSSTNDLTTAENKQAVLNALQQALPNRYIELRYPGDIRRFYPDPAEAVKARVAFHNDCFLSSSDDVGTYVSENGQNTLTEDHAYLSQLSEYAPVTGESCAVNPPRSECESALQELELLHVSSLNDAYHKGVLRSWKQGGCLAAIDARLGYRLVLLQADFNEQVRPGGLLRMEVRLKNIGFAAPVNPRPLFVVLQSEQEKHMVMLEAVDVRHWQPGEHLLQAALRLPSTISAGNYRLALWLPDEAASLRENPLYAIRFANLNTWDEANGYNVLGSVEVTSAAAGSFQEGDSLHVEAAASSLHALFSKDLLNAFAQPLSSPILLVEDNPSVYLAGEALLFRYHPYNLARSYQLFLDVDGIKSGYRIQNIKSEFLLENDTFYRYVGKGQEWKWAYVTGIETFADGTIEWKIPLEMLQPLDSLHWVFRILDNWWNPVFTSTAIALYLPQE